MNILDLFSGCGGLTEGFHQEGFKSVLHIDFDQPACETLRERLRDLGYKDYEIKDVLSFFYIFRIDFHYQNHQYSD